MTPLRQSGAVLSSHKWVSSGSEVNREHVRSVSGLDGSPFLWTFVLEAPIGIPGPNPPFV